MPTLVSIQELGQTLLVEMQEYGKTAYCLERQLGGDEQSKVWLAKQISTGIKVVVRELSNSRFSELRRAYVALRNIESASLPRPLDLIGGNANEAAWLVTTWIEGESLHVAEPGTWMEVLTELREIAKGLACIHAIGLHHGDISANNVIRGLKNKLNLTDFGSLGQLGCGTPGYLAPEVLRGSGGKASDVFSWASLFCFCLFGQTPWEAPSSVLGVRRVEQVSERLCELMPSNSPDLPDKLQRLLSLALHPDPTMRIPDATALMAYIDDVLESCSNWDTLTSGSNSWRLPSNWVYRGRELRSVVERILEPEEAPKLVVVTGPPGSGRSRTVHEIIQICQEHGREGSYILPSANPNAEDPEQFRRRNIEAWLDSESESAGNKIVGLGISDAHKGWGGAETADGHSATTLTTMLVFGAIVAKRTLVIACESNLVDSLGSIDNKNLEIVHLRPWTLEEIRSAVKSCGIGEDTELWADALLQFTNGWPGRVIKSIAICAAGQIDRPDLYKLEHAISDQFAALSLELAKRVLQRSWGMHTVELPIGFSGEDGWPFSWALASARRTFAMSSESLIEYASQHLAQSKNASHDGTVQLYIDAEHISGIEQIVADACDQDIDVDRNIERWIVEQGFDRVSSDTTVVILRQLIREGKSREVVDLTLDPTLGSILDFNCESVAKCTHDPASSESTFDSVNLGIDDLECRLELAKALQQLGRSRDSLAIISEVIFDQPPYGFAKLALRWRGLCDLGQAGLVVEESQQWRAVLVDSSKESDYAEDCGLACTWAAYAAWLNGAKTEPWIELARSIVIHRRSRRARGVAARIEQIRGAIAWSSGEPGQALSANRKAYEHYCAAGEENGRLLILGNLAAMSIPLGEIGYALAWGRKAVRELCTRSVVQPLSAALVNCVQALLYVNAFEEARVTIEGVRQVLTARDAQTAVDLARVSWLSSKVDVQHRLKSDRDNVPVVLRRLEEGAIQLEQAGAFAESTDAWLHLTRCYIELNQRLLAWNAWHRAYGLSSNLEDKGLCVEILLEALSIGENGELPEHEMLHRIPPLAELPNWLDNGQILLAHKYLKILVSSHRLHDLAVDLRRKLVVALHRMTESLMSKVNPLDRESFRENLLGNSDSSDSLGELIRGIENPLIVQSGGGAPVNSVGIHDPGPKSLDSHWPRLFRIYRRLARESELKGAINHVLEAVLELSGAERGVVIVYDSDGKAIEEARQLAQENDVVAFSRSIIEQVRQSAEPVLSVDAATDQRFDQSQSVHHLRLRSVLAVPLLHQSALIGVIYVDHRLRRGAFDENDLEMIEDFANLAALALSHTRANERLRQQTEQLDTQRQKLEDLLDQREIEVQSLRETVRSHEPVRSSFYGMIGSSIPMQEVYRKIERLANTHVPVSIYGESGTGKELVARALHQSSDRSAGPFVAENCGAIPESLIESVLFGHARGAFTGADQARPGLFEAANGGTIFLDEISEMPLSMQTKLLRVLQEGEVRRIGESSNRKLNVRVITASNRDLKELVEKEKFRQDLFYRICVVGLQLPSLRERSEDIKPLCEHLFSKFGRSELRIDTSAMRLLMRYAWPGNVRELENEIQRWIALCDQRVEVHDLSTAVRDENTRDQDPDDLAIKPRVAALERELIRKAFLRTRGNQTQAAELLGLSRFGLQKKLRRLNETGEKDPSTKLMSSRSANPKEPEEYSPKARGQ